MLLGLFTPIMNSIVLPAFSRNHDRSRLIRRYFLILGAFAIPMRGADRRSSDIFGASALAARAELCRIAPLLLLMTFNAALGILAGGMWSMNAAKGWVEYVWAEIPLRLLLPMRPGVRVRSYDHGSAIHFAIWSQLSPMLETPR